MTSENKQKTNQQVRQVATQTDRQTDRHTITCIGSHIQYDSDLYITIELQTIDGIHTIYTLH